MFILGEVVFKLALANFKAYFIHTVLDGKARLEINK